MECHGSPKTWDQKICFLGHTPDYSSVFSPIETPSEASGAGPATRTWLCGLSGAQKQLPLEQSMLLSQFKSCISSSKIHFLSHPINCACAVLGPCQPADPGSGAVHCRDPKQWHIYCCKGCSEQAPGAGSSPSVQV